jgi:ABC-type dipeptide/oligopeptide/nickel transport system permease subunit
VDLGEGSAAVSVWRVIRSDRMLLASTIAALFLVASITVGPPILAKVLGHSSDTPLPYATDPIKRVPVGPFSRVWDTTREFTDDTGYLRRDPPKGTGTTLLILGADGTLGRDELLRLLEGGRTSLEVAVGGTILAMLIGVLLGTIAGFRGGFVDAAVQRATEFVMAFPLLLLVIAIGSQSSNRLDYITLGFLPKGVVSLVLLIGAFTWFYPARIIRTEVAALRNREFIEAAVMVGAKDARILRTHVLPHVLPTALVYTTLLIPVNVLLEAGITFLGVGIKLPTPSWGNLLAAVWGSVLNPITTATSLQSQIWLTILPSAMIFVTVFTFNQLGEGLREAFDAEARG